MMAGTAPVPAGFDELIGRFVAATLDLDTMPLPPTLLPMETWPGNTAQLVAKAGAGYLRRRGEREHRLMEALTTIAPQVSPATLTSFSTARLDIAPTPDFRALGDSDLCYVKINHGFWEQIYALFGKHDPLRMRIVDPRRFGTRYIASAFVDALVAATAAIARPNGARLHFDGVHLGSSIHNGTIGHDAILAGFPNRETIYKQVVLGAAIGLTAWWESLFPGLQPALCDGSFPKHGLATGLLRETLAWAADRSDRIVFVVPPHLDRIRLADTTVPQESVLVPAKTVHESWVDALRATAGHVLACLAADGRVLVITQSAVFSALLGFFLAHARRQLPLPGTVLRYFDLGQTLDVAAPESGGMWVRRNQAVDISLFHLAVA
jgi:hypothetical protein